MIRCCSKIGSQWLFFKKKYYFVIHYYRYWLILSMTYGMARYFREFHHHLWAMSSFLKKWCSCLGPDHMAVLIWPFKGVNLVEWSPSKDLPRGDSYYEAERPLYFVNYFSGTRPLSPYTFSITLQVPPARIPFLFRFCLRLIF